MKETGKPAGCADRIINNIWFVTREYDGLAGAGGVKDVCRQLAEALSGHGNCQVQVVLPGYGFMTPDELGFTRLTFSNGCSTFFVDMDYPDRERREQVSVWQKTIQGVEVFLLDSPRFTEKNGVYTYTEEDEKRQAWQRRGMGHYDYFAMNILLQKATLDLLILLDQRPWIIHCHDGHAACLPALIHELPGYRHFFSGTGALVTIHNAGKGYHQEVEDLVFARVVTGLPESVIRASQLGKSFDPFLSAAGRALLNTVSENYARELQETREDARTGWLGHQLLKRGVRLAGITNGINPQDFDPSRAAALGLAASFAPAKGDLAGKQICKKDMLARCSATGTWQRVSQYGTLRTDLEPSLFTFIGRLTAQKGVDVLLKALPLLLEDKQCSSLQLLILGSGDPALEKQLQSMTLSPAFQGRICFLKGYDPALANQIYAAGDFFIIPSLYEPCGLTDYMAQLMGNLPIVHHVGGLVKVVDGKTGFAYPKHSSAQLAETMRRALTLYREDPDMLEAMQRRAVEHIHARYTWEKVMRKYLDLYGESVRMIRESGVDF